MAKDSMNLCSHATCSCSYCDCQLTQLEFALHKLTNGHVKNIQKVLFQRGFSSVCLVCNLAMKDLKQMELHVPEKKHTEQMVVLNNFLSPDKHTCRSCGIAFFNEVALEAHHLLGLHSLEASPQASPKLNELSKQLSGLCGTWPLTNGCNLCSVCNVTVDGIQETVMHCFTSAHITRLRASFCMVCKKEFMHSTDREAHLNSAKHLSNIRKCSHLLEECDTQRSHRRGGYACMFCMVWCNSWFCLELHLLETHHNKVIAEHRRNNPLASRMLFATGFEGTGSTCSCDESVMDMWKLWREQASEEHIWCHRCALTFFGIDETDQHLADGCQLLTDAAHLQNVSGSAQFPNTYECGICTMSFKSIFMLNAHTASLEHHRRLGALNSSYVAYCCSNCGLLVEKDRYGNAVSVFKGSTGSLALVKDSEAVLSCLKPSLFGLHTADDDGNLGVTRYLMDHQVSSLSVLKENLTPGSAGHFHHTDANAMSAKGNINEDRSKPKLIGTGAMTDYSLKIKQSIQGINNNGNDPVIDESGGVGCLKDGGSMPTNIFGEQIGNLGAADDIRTENSKNNRHVNVCDSARVVNSCNLPFDLSLKLPKSEDCSLPQNEGLVPCQRPPDRGTVLVKNACLGDMGVPVIVAATLAPLEGLQESLKSVSAIVTETLLSSVSNLYSPVSASLLKRKRQGGVDDAVESTHLKGLYGEEALEAALRQGLKSIKPENGGYTFQQGVLKDGLRLNSTIEINGKQDLRAVVAVAASAIPSGLPDLYRTSDQNQTVATEAQESSGARIPDNAHKQAQELADMRSGSLGEVANQTVMEWRVPHKVVDKTGAQAGQPFECKPGVIPICPPKYMQASASLAKGRTTGDRSLEGRKTAAPLHVPSHNSNSESNEECNDYNSEGNKPSFLDPTKGLAKWWSDSDDTDSM